MKKIIFILLGLCILPSYSYGVARDISCEEATAILYGNHTKTWSSMDSGGIPISGTDFNDWTIIDTDKGGISQMSLCIYAWKYAKPDITQSSKWDTALASNTEYIIMKKGDVLSYYAKRPYTQSLFLEDLKKLNDDILRKQVAESEQNIKAEGTQSGGITPQLHIPPKVEETIASSGALMEPKTNTKKLSTSGQKRANMIQRRIELLQKQILKLQKQLEELP